MNEQQAEQIQRLAERMGLEGVAELCADWRALKAENERLKEAGAALVGFATDYASSGKVCCALCYVETPADHDEDCAARAFVQP